MNTEIIKTMANELAISENKLKCIIFIREGATVPFIARYRKEKTGWIE